MKTPEEMAELFRSMPSKRKENPYWRFAEDGPRIDCILDEERMPFVLPGEAAMPLPLYNTTETLIAVREFFRRFYESFRSEAQVLCVHVRDARKLKELGVPVLTEGAIGTFDVSVVVLPQDNHMGTSVISEAFWQRYIVGNGIVPVARIHSHHILQPYQSITDYSTLNSGTLEMVLGRIFDDPLYMCCWLDVPGTDTKAQTFIVKQKGKTAYDIRTCRFHGEGSAWMDEPENDEEAVKVDSTKAEQPEEAQ